MVMKELFALRWKIYSYLLDGDSKYKKAKGRSKCAIKRETKFNDYKKCQFNNGIMQNHNKDLKVN